MRISAALLVASCVVDGTVLAGPGVNGSSVVGCEPLDAGVGPVDAGPPDAGAPDAGARDAGAPADAGCFADPCAACGGCCEAGACQPGTLTRQCGRSGAACRACSAGSLCLGGTCTVPSPGSVDLSVDDDVVVTDFRVTDGGVALTVSATVRNRGDQTAYNVAWAIVVSDNTTLNLITDDLIATSTEPFDLGPFSTRRVTLRGQGPLLNGAGITPNMVAFALADWSGVVIESNEANNFNGGAFSTGPAACRAATCSGCCTSAGCTPASDLSALACGRAGAACGVCSSGQGCDAGVCQ